MAIAAGGATGEERSERYYLATQWQLMAAKFRGHQLARFGAGVLVAFYLAALFAEFIATEDMALMYTETPHAPPRRIHVFDENGSLRSPFVYAFIQARNQETLRMEYREDRSRSYRLRLCSLPAIHTGCGACSTPASTCSASRRGRSTCSAATGSGATCFPASSTLRASA